LVASLTVVILNFLVPNIRKNQNFRYISYLSLANSFFSSSSIVELNMYWNASASSSMILITLFLSTFSCTAIYVWAILFAVNVLNLISNNSIKWIMNEKICLCLGYGFPALTGLISVLIAWYGNIGFLFNKTYTLVTYLVPLCILLWNYFLIIRTSRTMMNPETSKKLIRQIIVYPIVLTMNLILCLIGSLILDSDQCLTQGFTVLTSMWYLQGFVDALCYGVNPTLRQELRAFCSRKSNNQDLLSCDGNSSVGY